MIKLQNVSKFYSSNDSVALGLRRISLEFSIGEFIAITGESGSGKSTLLNVLSGLDTYEEGEMFINHLPTSHFSEYDWENYRNTYLSFVFQKYNVIESYTVYQNIEAALIIKGLNASQREQKINQIIDRVGLSSKKNQKTSTLSGGEIQRTVIARALAKDSKIIVCDEPTGNLDSETSIKIMELLHEISKNRLVIVVTHNYDLVSKYCTRKIRLFDGEIAEDKDVRNVIPLNEEDVVYSPYKLKMREYFKLTFYNLSSSMKKTAFMLFVFFFISIVFLLTLGARLYQNALDPFRGYGVFEEAQNSRIIVTKRDYSNFTSSELTMIRNIEHVEGIVDYDVVFDLKLLYAEYNELHNAYDYSEFMINSMLSIEEDELLEGTLPTKDNEIIIGPLLNIDVGSEVTMSFSRKSLTGPEDITFSETFKVVGIYKSIFPETIRSNAYFTTSKLNEIGKFVLSDYTDYNLYPTNLDFEKDEKTSLFIIINNDLEVNKVIVSNEVYTENCFYYLERSNCYEEDNEVYFQNTDFLFSGVNHYNNEKIVIPVEIVYDSNSYGFQISSDTIESVIDYDVYQPSIVIKDGYHAENVLYEIENLGFKAFYPAGVEEEYNLIFIIITELQFILNMLIVLIITYFISYYVLRNIMISKSKDYLVFRSFGTTKSTLNSIVHIEFSILATIGYLMAIVILVINQSYGKIIPKYLRFYTIFDYVLLLVILIALVLLLVRRFNSKIFYKSVITSMNRE